LKIIDFGLARELASEETVNEYCGSLGYIAPEIYKREHYRFEVDMFSFGVILFRLLSGGEKPFPATSEGALRRATEGLEYNVDSNAWKDVSPSAKQLVQKLLVAREERLNAHEALHHEWFLDSSAFEIGPTGPRHSFDHKYNSEPNYKDAAANRSSSESALSRFSI